MTLISISKELSATFEAGLDIIASNPRFSWIHPLVHRLLELYGPDQLAVPETLIEQPLIFPISEYRGESPRLVGFQLDEKEQNKISQYVFNVPLLPINPITVIDDKLYNHWHNNKDQFTESDAEYVKQEATYILERSHRVTLRRAIYKKSDKTIPNASTFNNKQTPEQVLKSLHQLYQEYAQHYDDPLYIKEAMMYEYIDPVEIHDPLNAEDLPIGGIAIPLQNIEDTNGHILISVRSGVGDSALHNEVHPEADEVIIRVNKPSARYPAGDAYIMGRTTYPVKTNMYVQRKPKSNWNSTAITTAVGERSAMWCVPIKKQIVVPTVPDTHAIAIALHLANTMWSSKTTRKLEFSYGPAITKTGKKAGLQPYILENVPFKALENANGRTIIGTGPLTAILNKADDLLSLKSKIRGVSLGHFPTDKPIIAVSAQFLDAMRVNPSLRDQLEGIGGRVIIIGSISPTEHVVRALQGNHMIAAVSQSILKEIVNVESAYYNIGTRYTIVRKDGVCMLMTPEEEAGEAIPPFLTIPQAIHMGIVHPNLVGGKFFGLAQLYGIHYPIPENTLGLTNTFFHELIKFNGLEGIFDQLVDAETPQELEELFEDINKRLDNIPPDLEEALFDRMKSMSGGDKNIRFALRSNMSIEDAGKHPMAGSFTSILDIPLEKTRVMEALLQVIHNYFRPNIATQIFRQLSGDERVEKLNSLLGSVMIQEMLPAKFSGTLFTHDLGGATDSEKQSLLLQYNVGVGGVVDGNRAYLIRRARNGDVDQISLKDEHGEIRPVMTATEFNQLPGDDTTLGLSKNTILGLFKLGKNAAKAFGQIQQDMEWAYTKDDEIIFLQTRPILTI